MADWQSLRAEVVTSYQVGVDELERFQNPEWDGLSVWVATSRGQHLVSIMRRQDHNGDWYVQLSAPISTTTSPDAMSLLRWNGRNPAGALVINADELFHQRVYPLEWLDSPRLHTALRDVAGTSAGLEAILAERGSI
jgi:hypothetical protein